LVSTAVISKSIAIVSVLVFDLMIPVTEDYIETTTLMIVSGDMGRTLTVLALT
jgi:hypothetical protein